MKKILLIGSGNVGSRHLQSILKLNINTSIYVVEKSKKSTNTAQQRCKEIKQNKKIIYLNFYLNLSSINDTKYFDFCIIATSSDTRLIALKDVIKKFNIKYLILEKVLFQNTLECDLAYDLIKKNNVKSWVNCHRREIPSWIKLKKIIKKFSKK